MRELIKENIIEDAKRVMRDIPEFFSEDAMLAFDDLDIEIIERHHAHEVRVSSKQWNVVSIALTMPIIIALIKYYPNTILMTPYMLNMKVWSEVNVLSDKPFSGETVFFRIIAIKNADEDILKYIAEKGNEKCIQDTLKLCDVYNCIESKALLLKYIKSDDTSEDMML